MIVIIWYINLFLKKWKISKLWYHIIYWTTGNIFKNLNSIRNWPVLNYLKLAINAKILQWCASPSSKCYLLWYKEAHCIVHLNKWTQSLFFYHSVLWCACGCYEKWRDDQSFVWKKTCQQVDRPHPNRKIGNPASLIPVTHDLQNSLQW